MRMPYVCHLACSVSIVFGSLLSFASTVEAASSDGEKRAPHPQSRGHSRTSSLSLSAGTLPLRAASSSHHVPSLPLVKTPSVLLPLTPLLDSPHLPKMPSSSKPASQGTGRHRRLKTSMIEPFAPGTFLPDQHYKKSDEIYDPAKLRAYLTKTSLDLSQIINKLTPAGHMVGGRAQRHFQYALNHMKRAVSELDQISSLFAAETLVTEEFMKASKPASPSSGPSSSALSLPELAQEPRRAPYSMASICDQGFLNLLHSLATTQAHKIFQGDATQSFDQVYDSITLALYQLTLIASKEPEEVTPIQPGMQFLRTALMASKLLFPKDPEAEQKGLTEVCETIRKFFRQAAQDHLSDQVHKVRLILTYYHVMRHSMPQKLMGAAPQDVAKKLAQGIVEALNYGACASQMTLKGVNKLHNSLFNPKEILNLIDMKCSHDAHGVAARPPLKRMPSLSIFEAEMEGEKE